MKLSTVILVLSALCGLATIYPFVFHPEMVERWDVSVHVAVYAMLSGSLLCIVGGIYLHIRSRRRINERYTLLEMDRRIHR